MAPSKGTSANKLERSMVIRCVLDGWNWGIRRGRLDEGRKEVIVQVELVLYIPLPNLLPSNGVFGLSLLDRTPLSKIFRPLYW
jgi:hypothetical protein